MLMQVLAWFSLGKGLLYNMVSSSSFINPLTTSITCNKSEGHMVPLPFDKQGGKDVQAAYRKVEFFLSEMKTVRKYGNYHMEGALR